MKKEFIPYEQAVALKTLGFNEPCLGFYDINFQITIGKPTEYLTSNEKANYMFGGVGEVTLAPLYSQAFRWLWEQRGYFGEIFVDDDQTFGYLTTLFASNKSGRIDNPMERGFKTHEEARLACLIYIIKLIDYRNCI